MPWTAGSGRSYDLCLLDTNALSEIAKKRPLISRGFFELFGPASHAPCLTVYNIFELRRKPDLFNSFLDIFSICPIFLLKPHSEILNEERSNSPVDSDAIIMNAFTQLGQGESYDIRLFMERLLATPSIKSLRKNWRRDERKTLKSWLMHRKNFDPKSEGANASDADRYVEEASRQILMQKYSKWATKVNSDDFPALKTMLYSQYYRIFDLNRKPTSQDVTDVRIMACAPYVDVVITENFQADIFRRVKHAWSRIRHLEVVTLADLRSAAKKSAYKP